mmetsp:Transcript_36818/g.86622  ORF Transcript_36818/g.86622 Transcript_36818/m.86622 type:complete len:303 (-) Transcript_36818:86-994(-)
MKLKSVPGGVSQLLCYLYDQQGAPRHRDCSGRMRDRELGQVGHEAQERAPAHHRHPRRPRLPRSLCGHRTRGRDRRSGRAEPRGAFASLCSEGTTGGRPPRTDALPQRSVCDRALPRPLLLPARARGCRYCSRLCVVLLPTRAAPPHPMRHPPSPPPLPPPSLSSPPPPRHCRCSDQRCAEPAQPPHPLLLLPHLPRCASPAPRQRGYPVEGGPAPLSPPLWLSLPLSPASPRPAVPRRGGARRSPSLPQPLPCYDGQRRHGEARRERIRSVDARRAVSALSLTASTRAQPEHVEQSGHFPA